MKTITLLSYWVCCEAIGFFIFFLRDFRGTKFLPISTLSPFTSNLTQEQEWQQYFWANIKIKGYFWLRNLGERVFYIPEWNPYPGSVPQAQWRWWPVHEKIWEAGDHPYLDVPWSCDQKMEANLYFQLTAPEGRREELWRSILVTLLAASLLKCSGGRWVLGRLKEDRVWGGQIVMESVVLANWSVAAGKLEGGKGGGWEDVELCPAPGKWQLAAAFHFLSIHTGKACGPLCYPPSLPLWSGN